MQELYKNSDNDLIIEARKGNDSAFTVLVQRYDRKVLSIAAHYFQCSDDAKDVYQEVFIRVYKNLAKFEFRSEFSTWLYRITTNVCLTHKSRKKEKGAFSYMTDESEGSKLNNMRSPGELEPEKQMINDEMKKKVNGLIDTLSPKQKMVFILKHINDYKIKEIAAIMNCTEGTVKKYLFLATDKLRLKLKEISF